MIKRKTSVCECRHDSTEEKQNRKFEKTYRDLMKRFLVLSESKQEVTQHLEPAAGVAPSDEVHEDLVLHDAGDLRHPRLRHGSALTSGHQDLTCRGRHRESYRSQPTGGHRGRFRCKVMKRMVFQERHCNMKPHRSQELEIQKQLYRKLS